MKLVLDSSVIVTALISQEEEHEECKRILEKVVKGELIIIEPLSVFIEVVAAIRRRTGSAILAEKVGKDLQNIGTAHFLELVNSRAKKAADIAKKTGVRGMDAIVIQIAEEFSIPLVTLDEDIKSRVSKIVEVKDIKDF